MKLSTVQILSALFTTVLGTEVSDVYDLSENTFQDHIDSHSLVLAEFFAPWCGHCKNLAPEYEQAATELKKHSEDITLAKIDCTENRDFCSQQSVQGFPTLYIYENGVKTGQYEGARKAADIKNFLIKRSQPVVTNVKDSKGLESWLKENQEESPVTVLYLGPKANLNDFTKAATEKRDRITFISAEDTALRKKYGSDLVIFKKGEETVKLPAGSDLDVDSISHFVHINEMPHFGELGPETYSLYIQHGTPMLYAFVDDEKSRDLVKSAVKPHIETLRGKANVVFLNASLYGMHTENVNLRAGQYPAMVVHDVKSNKKYVHNQDIELSKESISDFIKKYVAGEIEARVKSEDIPESQDGPVFKLVGAQYDEVVLNNDKDVLVEYYAPWCGHCKNLKPTYDELGELYADNDNVVIAQLDHTVNEVPDDIQGYPTIKLYAAGKKDEPIVYSSSRDLDSLASFIQKEGTHKAAPGKKPLPKNAAEKKSSDSIKEEL